MSDNYKIYAECQNCCGSLEIVEIPKGVEVKKELKERTCGTCGLKGHFVLQRGVKVEEGR